jgi:hypothetical protein
MMDSETDMHDEDDLDCEQDSPPRLFLVYWCMEGIELVRDITDLQYEQTMGILRGDKKGPWQLGQMLTSLRLRAQTNTQRRYEMYAINVDASITEQDMIDQFNQSPQGMADLVRERGQCLYSDRQRRAPAII